MKNYSFQWHALFNDGMFEYHDANFLINFCKEHLSVEFHADINGDIFFYVEKSIDSLPLIELKTIGDLCGWKLKIEEKHCKNKFKISFEQKFGEDITDFILSYNEDMYAYGDIDENDVICNSPHVSFNGNKLNMHIFKPLKASPISCYHVNFFYNRKTNKIITNDLIKIGKLYLIDGNTLEITF